MERLEDRCLSYLGETEEKRFRKGKREEYLHIGFIRDETEPIRRIRQSCLFTASQEQRRKKGWVRMMPELWGGSF